MTAAEVARKVGIPVATFNRLVLSGEIETDYICSRFHLFTEPRVAEIKAHLEMRNFQALEGGELESKLKRKGRK